MTSTHPAIRPDGDSEPPSDTLWPKLSERRSVVLLLVCMGLAATVALAILSVGGGSSRASQIPAHSWPASVANPSSVPAIAPEIGLELPPGAEAATRIGLEADMARRINAGIAFVPEALVPAPSFLWAGNTIDRERATDCLAATGFYEAGTRPADQRAVMQVVLNRVRHHAFPNSICGVVFQGAERATGCQFTFTCDGAMMRRQPSPEAWRQARLVAIEMLTGRTEPAVSHATHYHTDWVHPAWSGRMDKIASVDTHLFFRWRGRFGEPGAFTARYSGAEPSIGRMARLSVAHQGNDPLFGNGPALRAARLVPTNVLHDVDLAMPSEALPDQGRSPDDDVFLASLDRSSPDGFLRQAEQACAGKRTCRFLGWVDPARKAVQLPISGAANDAMSFSYIKNGAEDPGKARWNCKEFPRDDGAQCLRRGG